MTELFDLTIEGYNETLIVHFQKCRFIGIGIYQHIAIQASTRIINGDMVVEIVNTLSEHLSCGGTPTNLHALFYFRMAVPMGSFVETDAMPVKAEVHVAAKRPLLIQEKAFKRIGQIFDYRLFHFSHD